jgi:hypothetical protein
MVPVVSMDRDTLIFSGQAGHGKVILFGLFAPPI